MKLVPRPYLHRDCTLGKNCPCDSKSTSVHSAVDNSHKNAMCCTFFYQPYHEYHYEQLNNTGGFFYKQHPRIRRRLGKKRIESSREEMLTAGILREMICLARISTHYICMRITSLYVSTSLLRASIINLKLTSAFAMAIITS